MSHKVLFLLISHGKVRDHLINQQRVYMYANDKIIYTTDRLVRLINIYQMYVEFDTLKMFMSFLYHSQQSVAN